MNIQMIAPCGMNCGICLAHLRDKNICKGCWSDTGCKSISCTKCSIKNCELLEKTRSKFCYECIKFPCSRLKQLDKRYRLKYCMSMLGNLHCIKKFGLEKFMEMETIKWKCITCGGTVCVHTGYCLTCNIQANYINKKQKQNVRVLA